MFIFEEDLDRWVFLSVWALWTFFLFFEFLVFGLGVLFEFVVQFFNIVVVV